MSQAEMVACDRCGDRWRSNYLRHLLVGETEHWLCAHCVGVICEWWCLDHAAAIGDARRVRNEGEQAYVR